MRNSDFNENFFTFCFFLLSLNSVYFFSLQVASLSGLFFSILMLGLFWRNLYLGNQSVVLLYVFLFLVTSFASVLFLLDVDIKRIVAFLLLIASSLVAGILVQKVDLKKVVLSFLAIHCFFFYLQFFGYFIFDIYIDYLGLVGLESRNFGGTFTLPVVNKMMRASGPFNEPGTYATFIAPVVAISIRYMRHSDSKLLPYAALLSLSLTFSTFGFVFSMIILAFSPIKKSLKIVATTIFSVFSVPYIYWKFVIRSQEGVSTAISFREEFINATIEAMGELRGVFHGYGGFSAVPFDFSAGGAVNDSGLIFTMLYYFGLIPTVFFVVPLFIFAVLRGGAAVSTTLIVFISKINFFAVILPFYLIMALQKRSVFKKD